MPLFALTNFTPSVMMVCTRVGRVFQVACILSSFWRYLTRRMGMCMAGFMGTQEIVNLFKRKYVNNFCIEQNLGHMDKLIFVSTFLRFTSDFRRQGCDHYLCLSNTDKNRQNKHSRHNHEETAPERGGQCSVANQLKNKLP